MTDELVRVGLVCGSSCHRALCSICISPMFRCLCWGQVLSKHLRSAVAAPSSISSSSRPVSILASSGSQRLETDAIPQAVIVLHVSPAATRLLGESRLLPALYSRDRLVSSAGGTSVAG